MEEKKRPVWKIEGKEIIKTAVHEPGMLVLCRWGEFFHTALLPFLRRDGWTIFPETQQSQRFIKSVRKKQTRHRGLACPNNKKRIQLCYCFLKKQTES